VHPVCSKENTEHPSHPLIVQKERGVWWSCGENTKHPFPPCPMSISKLDFFGLRNLNTRIILEEKRNDKRIQFWEEELSGGKWALTDRWTLGTGQAETKRGSVRI